MNCSAFLLVLSAVIFSTSVSLRIPDRTRGSIQRPTQRQPSTSNTRGGRTHAPRLFDEFLLTVATSGAIPEIDANSFVMNNRTSRPTSRNTVHTSLRNYIRHQRNRDRDITDDLQSLLDADAGSEGNTNSEETSDPIISNTREQRSNLVGGGGRVRRQNIQGAGFDNFLLDEFRSYDSVPREHWPCCTLGELAGDKGFLCEAQFYANRNLLDRLPNRVHHRRLTGTYFQNGSATENGNQLLRSFYRCVQSRSDAREFETCCDNTFSAYQQREARWREFRHSVTPES